MKIRSDFVTNSSSSSYTTVQIQNKVLYELLRSYRHQMQLGMVSRDVISLVPCRDDEEVGYPTDCPDYYEEAIARVWEILERRAQACPEQYTKLVAAKADIDACYEKILFVDVYEEWGGDGDLRYEWPLSEKVCRDGAGEEAVYYYSADLANGSATETSGCKYYSLKKRPTIISGFDHPNLLKADFEKTNMTVPKIDATEIAKGYAEHTEQMNDFVIDNHVLVQYTGSEEDVVIPDTVTAIDSEAFYNFRNLVSITIPRSVTSIADGTFKDCTKLTSVTLPDSITSIGAFAFSRCKSLTSIDIPNSVTFIGYSAFSFCDNLKSVTLPNSIKTIEWSTFKNCGSLTALSIPDSVTSIGGSAFSCCESLTSIDIPNSVTFIDYSAFSFCSNLKSVTLPNSIKTIESTTFHYCDSLTALSIPDSVTSIEKEAFRQSGLESIIIPNSVTSIGERAFSECENLKSITIPDSVAFIGQDAFLQCYNLTNVKFSDFINWASKGVFDSCRGLADESGLAIAKDRLYACKSEVRSITIPDSVTKIGKRAFFCSNLDSVIIPNSVTSIGEEAFIFSNLTDIVISDSVTRIDYRAFGWCEKLTSLNIPKSVEYIGPEAFLYCSLESLRIDASAIDIGNNAFAGCNKFKTIITNVALPRSAFVETRFRKPIATVDPTMLPPKARKKAIVGYAENPEEFIPGRHDAHINYLKKNAPKLLDEMLEYPALLRLTIENRLLSPKTAGSLLKVAIGEGKNEAVAMLKDYLENKPTD